VKVWRRRVAVTVSAVAAGLVLASCSSGDSSAPAVKAKVDPASGSVVLPFDEYWPTPEDTGRLAYALNLTLSACMRKHGITYPAVRPPASAALTSWGAYGVWRMDDARRYGYDPPVPDRKSLQEPQLQGREAQQEEQCLQTPEAKALRLSTYYRPEVMQQYSFMRLPPVTSTPAGKQVLDEWRSCLTQAQVPVPPAVPDGAPVVWVSPDLDKATPEQRIKDAVADVTCKQKVDLVQRIADLEAAAQQAVVKDHQDELAAFRQIWLPMRQQADRAIAAAGA
jgi:hypothetical protein